jgi:holin-like protein
MIYGLLILFSCQLAGEVIARYFALTVPGSVLGMLILFVGLIIRRRVPAELESASAGILKPLVLYFIPASVGMMTMGPLIAQEGVRILIVLVLSTVLPLLICGYGLDYWLSRKEAK